MIKLNSVTVCLLAVIVVLCGVVLYMYLNRSDGGSNNALPTPPPARPPQSMQNEIPTTPVGGDGGGPPGPPVLVLFLSEQCGHCRNMMPAWMEAKKALNGKITIYELESSNPEVAKHGITGFPTIRLYPSGFSPKARFIQYNGDRSPQSFVNFATGGDQK